MSCEPIPEQDVHPAVLFLVERMGTHPEEFGELHPGDTPCIERRWDRWIVQLQPLMNDTEKDMIFDATKALTFQRAHEEMLDELFNGEERRAKEREEHNARMAQQAQQAIWAQQQLVGTYTPLGGNARGYLSNQTQNSIYPQNNYTNTAAGTRV